MKKINLFLFILPHLLLAQAEYPVSAIPAALIPNADIVVRLDETTFTIHSDGDAAIEETYVATILKEAGKKASIYGGQESRFSKIKTLKGRLFDAEGKLVRSTKPEDVQEFGGAAEYEFTDHKQKYLRLEYPRFPYTVEFKKKTLLKGFMGIPSSVIQTLGVSIEQWHYRLEAPNSIKLKWKGQNIDIQPKTSADGRNFVMEWSTQNLPAQADEAYNPYFRDIFSQINFAPEEINFDGHHGDFKSWNSVGRFFYGLNNDRETLSPETIAQVQKLTEGKSTKEKIAALYRMTQDNCRYVSIQLGIGGWQTLEARFVEQKKYGDCKALSNYTQALLQAAGIESWEASIYAGDGGAPEYDEAFPDPYFNHVILYVPGEDSWLECTSKTHPAGYLGSFTANRHALLYTPEGGKLVKTPALLAADNFEKSRMQIALNEDGSAALQFSALFGGERHEPYRRFALEKTQDDLEKSIARNADFSINKVNKLVVEATRELSEASLHYQVETSKYATISGKRMFVSLTKSNPVKRSIPANEKRTLDLKMTDTYSLRDTFTIQFPTGFVAENVPQDKFIESEFGLYEMKIEKLSDRIIATRSVEIRPLQVSAARYAEVRQFLLDSAKADAAQMVLIKQQ
ncbi:MAG: DUF3857 domain-containing protein [Saprospiraceae bacterium]